MPAKRFRLTAGLLAATASIAMTCAFAGPALAIPADAGHGRFVPIQPTTAPANPAQQDLHASTALALAEKRLHQRGSLGPAATSNDTVGTTTESSSTATVALVFACAAMLIALVAATATYMRSRQPVART
jgi:hypothetical protein